MSIRRDYKDIEYTVVAEQDHHSPNHVIGFKAFQIVGTNMIQRPVYKNKDDEFVESMEEAELFLEGEIKWDGCSNWDFPGLESCMMHFCGPDQGKNLGILFERMYEIAKEMMPNTDWD